MNAAAWTTRAVPVFAGIGETHIKTGEDYTTRTMAEIFEMAPVCRPKLHGPAFIPSTYNGHDARSHRVQQERGAYIGLTGDIDNGDHPLPAIQCLVREFVGDAAWLIYSSPHARPGDRRWRVIVPFDGIAPFARWNDAQLAFFGFMEAGGIGTDHVMARAGQHVYLPNVPDRHSKTAEPLRDGDGSPLHYQRATTGSDAPGLRLDTGPIAAAIATVKVQRLEAERKEQRRRYEAERNRSSRSQQYGESPIDSFNRENSLQRLFARYRYAQSLRHPGNWRSPLQTGDSYATQEIGGGKWFSLSGSDADAGLGSRLRTGCIGDAFDLFVQFEHGGDRASALRQLRDERWGVAA